MSVIAAVAALACVPTLLLHASAWLDPDATTGGIMGAGAYACYKLTTSFPDANIILGATFDPDMNGRIRVAVVATGTDATMVQALEPMLAEPFDPLARRTPRHLLWPRRAGL